MYRVERDRRKQFWITKLAGKDVYGVSRYVRHDGPFKTRGEAEVMLPGVRG